MPCRCESAVKMVLRFMRASSVNKWLRRMRLRARSPASSVGALEVNPLIGYIQHDNKQKHTIESHAKITKPTKLQRHSPN